MLKTVSLLCRVDTSGFTATALSACRAPRLSLRLLHTTVLPVVPRWVVAHF